MMKAVLIRMRQLSNHLQTCGRFILIDEDGDVVFQCVSLELPWNGNKRNTSCIPAGNYSVVKSKSKHFGADTFHVNSVPGRTGILIHPGNYTSNTEGCILLGEKFSDINNDEITDVTNSKNTIYQLKQLAENFELTILQI